MSDDFNKLKEGDAEMTAISAALDMIASYLKTLPLTDDQRETCEIAIKETIKEISDMHDVANRRMQDVKQMLEEGNHFQLELTFLEVHQPVTNVDELRSIRGERPKAPIHGTAQLFTNSLFGSEAQQPLPLIHLEAQHHLPFKLFTDGTLHINTTNCTLIGYKDNADNVGLIGTAAAPGVDSIIKMPLMPRREMASGDLAELTRNAYQITIFITNLTGAPSEPTGAIPREDVMNRGAAVRGDDSSAAWTYDDDSPAAKAFKDALLAVHEMYHKPDGIFANAAEVQQACVTCGLDASHIDADKQIIDLIVEGFTNLEKRKDVFEKGWTTKTVRESAGRIIKVWATIRDKRAGRA